MTDHTPSPATDGLRERLTALANFWIEDGQTPAPMCGVYLLEVLAAHPAPLADPAPEAAGIKRAMCGSVDQHLPHPMPCDSGCQPDWHKDDCAIYGTCSGLDAPADLPVATGVTTEDECDGSSLCTAPLHIHGCFADLDGSACDDPEDHPTPPSETATSDVGLREDEREALHPPTACDCDDHDHCPTLTPVYAAVEEILAARVAEAGARALREALGTTESPNMLRAMLLDAADRLADPAHRGNAHAWPEHAEMFCRLATRIGGE